jgi:hypothetical protein
MDYRAGRMPVRCRQHTGKIQGEPASRPAERVLGSHIGSSPENNDSLEFDDASLETKRNVIFLRTAVAFWLTSVPDRTM